MLVIFSLILSPTLISYLVNIYVVSTTLEVALAVPTWISWEQSSFLLLAIGIGGWRIANENNAKIVDDVVASYGFEGVVQWSKTTVYVIGDKE